MTADVILWLSLTLVMSSILMMGLIRRQEQEQGPGSIGWESVTIMVLYFLGVLLLLMDMNG